MQGHGNHRIESLIERDGAEEEGAERVAEGFDARVLEQMNQVLERSFVVAVGVGAIVAGEAGTATAADAMIVKGRFVQKGGAALGAEVIGSQRSGRGEAGFADRNPAGVPDGLAANLAILRKNKVKKGREDSLSYCRKERSVRIGYGPFREDTPPKPAVYNIAGLICYDPGTNAEPPTFSRLRCRYERRCAGAARERNSDLLR